MRGFEGLAAQVFNSALLRVNWVRLGLVHAPRGHSDEPRVWRLFGCLFSTD
jgi:hypothetical protein